MLTQLLALVLLVGLTATTLLLCFDKWGWLRAWEVKRPQWLMKRCDLCAGYWLSVALLIFAGAVIEQYLHVSWWAVPGVLLLALPAAAVARVLFGLSTGR